MRPLIGITMDVDERSVSARRAYFDAVAAAGGVPVGLVPPEPDWAPEMAASLVERVDGFVLTGGADPRMEPFGHPTHPAARTMHPHRQAFETALVRALEARRAAPVLGVCLGMQMMALGAGGRMCQHLPDVVPATAEDHREDRMHRLEVCAPDAVIRGGEVNSNHHQAVADAGRLVVVARAHDGVTEAVRDPSRPFYLGVQWHPERMGDVPMGWELFRALVAAAGGASR